MTTPDLARPGRVGRRDVLAEPPQEELIAKWEEFFEDQGYGSRIIAVADRYPEARSLDVPFEELNRFDTDMAIHLLRHPLNVLTAGEEAIRRLAPPGDEAVQIHLRIKGVPRDRRVQIRDLRAKHLGQFLAVEGLVRKSTEVRPRVVGALFQCLRCGTILKEEQEDQAFREPLECYEDQGGCGRSASATKFKLLTETSLFLDTQKIEVQEAPEGLRGGEEPQRLSAYIEDDLTGRINPGMRVVLNGILRSSQRGRPGAKSTLFDIFLDANSVELEQVEFEEIEVSEEDARQIREAASSPDIFRMTVNSIAPSIYGMHAEKEALALQLFSGIPKVMPDGRRIRGDVHILLVGDPGTGKSELLSYMSRLSPRGIYATGKAASAAGLCVAADSLVVSPDGFHRIGDVADAYFERTPRVRPVETSRAMGTVVTLDGNHSLVTRPLEAVWRLRPSPRLLEIRTRSGLLLRLTPATRVLVDHAMGQSWIRAQFLRSGMRIATAGRLEVGGEEAPLILDLLQDVRTRVAVEVDPSFMNRVAKELTSRFGTLREAARRLLISEDALCHRWRNGRRAMPMGTLLRLAEATRTSKDEAAEAILTYSQAGGHRIRLPVRLNEDLAYFVGLIAGDGSVERTRLGGSSIRFSNSEAALVRRYRTLVENLFGRTVDFTPKSADRAASSRFHSKLVGGLLASLGVPLSPKSSSITVPPLLLNARPGILAAYLRGLFDTDGTIQVRRGGGDCVSLSTTSQRLAEGIQMALLRFGIRASVRTRRVAGRRSRRLDGKVIVSRFDQHVLDIYGGPSLGSFRARIGFFHPAKMERLSRISDRRSHSNLDLVQSAGPHLREIRRTLGMTYADAYGPLAGFGRAFEGGRRGAGHGTLERLVASLESRYHNGSWEGMSLRLRPTLLDEVGSRLRASGIGPSLLATRLRTSSDRANEFIFRRTRRRSAIPARILKRLARFLRPVDPELAAILLSESRAVLQRLTRIPSRLRLLNRLAASDIRWEPVSDIRVVSPDRDPTVYDLTVRDAHAFVANGVLVHNTAAAVRDEFGEGRWTLEAGALVLADKGLACLHPDSELLIDGVPVTVESLFEENRAKRLISSGQAVDLCPILRSTMALDLDLLKTRSARVSLVTRRAYDGPVVRIMLNSGFEVRLTPDHLVLDGSTLTWRHLEDLPPHAALVSLQRIIGNRQPIFLLDIVADDWIVRLTASEKRELRSLLLRNFDSLAEVNRHYGLRREALSGRDAVQVGQLRRILRDLGLYQTWRSRILGFGRSNATERLKVATITPDLTYVLGFIYGDGHVSVSKRRSSVSVFQSRVHLAQIQRLLLASKRISGRSWGMSLRYTTGTIRGRPVATHSYHMHRGSNLIAFLYRWLTENSLANLLRLDDESLRGFYAGIMDSDGCISTKSGRVAQKVYKATHIEVLVSSNRRSNLRLLYGLRRFDIYARVREGRGVYRIQVTSRRDVDAFLRIIAPFSVKVKALPRPAREMAADHEEVPRKPLTSVLSAIRPHPVRLMRRSMWSTFYELRQGTRRPFKGTLAKLTKELRPWLSNEKRSRLEILAGRDYCLDQIREVRVEHHTGFVYDLRVPGVDNFLADGAVVHNCIDEIEKMNPQDRSAIHEALEQQRISVAKAGITAVLQARCAVLAAANPQFGRFDVHKYLSEQIALEPPLLSRFDAIFAILDRPETERDRQMADHILMGHRVGEIAERRREGLSAPEDREVEAPYTPHFTPEFLRKYVAHARRIYPVMTDEAMDAIKRKYLEIRKLGESPESSVPITPRQLESIIRFSEASARLRLSEVVSLEDAERAVRIVEYWMGKVAGEEGGRLDIDIIQTGISQSQREQIITLRDVINELAGPEGVADYEDIVRLAQERGIPPAKVDTWLKRWSQEGEIYSPAKNKYKLVERL